MRRELLEQQAASLGLPLIVIPLEAGCTNADYEGAFHAALEQVAGDQPEITKIAFGDLFLADVRAYRERLLADTKFSGLFPLWLENTRALAEQFINDGFKAILVCTDNTQLDTAFCGRDFDRALLADLPSGTDPCGENGEFHTFVHDGPIFSSPIPVVRGERVLREERFTYCDLLPTPS